MVETNLTLTPFSLTKGEEYTDQGQDYYEEHYRQRVLYHLAQRAEKMGMTLVPAIEPA